MGDWGDCWQHVGDRQTRAEKMAGLLSVLLCGEGGSLFLATKEMGRLELFSGMAFAVTPVRCSVLVFESYHQGIINT